MRQGFGFLISLLFHTSLVVGALFWANASDVKVDMDRPVYTVDLVTLAPPPPPAPVVEKVQEPVAEPVAKPVEAKSEPVAVAPEPKPEAKKISPKKVEKKTVIKKKPKPKPKPKPKKTTKQLLAEGMAAAKAKVASDEIKKTQALQRELAALKKTEGDKVYAHGGKPGGQEGDMEGGAVGGTGSGLSEVYALIVGTAIKKNWRYPAFAGEANIFATIEVELATDGKILTSKIVDSSNNPEFDSSALRAIKETEYVERPRTDRDRIIRINFNSQELSE